MFNNNTDFYPTPAHIINKMIKDVDFRYINSVLEPSAGKGDIVDVIKSKLKYAHYNYYNNKEKNWDIDCIEIDENLRHILKGKGYRVVHDDFLTYNSLKHYDLIIMNPPFSNGDKHLLKALDMVEKSGGQVVCLLNAETLDNPYSNSRKVLQQRLQKYHADIEYIENAFVGAERQTYVAVALVKVNIEKPEHNSVIIDYLKKEEIHRTETPHNYKNLIHADFIKGIVEQYNFEVKAGLNLIAEYNALQPLLLNTIKEDRYASCILELKLHYKDDESSLVNGFIKQTRMKYWNALFNSEQFMGLFTSNLRQKYLSKINELKDYDFSLFNIYSIRAELNKEMIRGVEDTILDLFDELSHKHHWYDETSKNIHYYNGWKTNSAFKINKKVIIPLSGYRDLGYSWGGFKPTDYDVIRKLSDIEKVFNYLDNGMTEDVDMNAVLKQAQETGQTSKIQLKYFTVTFYKKGTCHIEFTNLDLLKKFNLFGSQRKGWLPPSYGKQHYNSMTNEEKTVIDEFEGKESYTNVMKRKDYYIVETSKLLMLA